MRFRELAAAALAAAIAGTAVPAFAQSFRPTPGWCRLAAFSPVSSQVLTGHQAAHQKLLISKLSTARCL